MTSRLMLRRAVPTFRLPSSRGILLGPRDYRHRRNLVIFVADSRECSGCQAVLHDLAAHYDEIQEAEAEVLAVVGDPPDDVAGAHYPFPVLSDAGHQARDAFLHEQGSDENQVGLFLTDRFGQLYMQTVTSAASELPGATELLDWLQYIEMQCPECGAPEWPEEAET